MGTLISSLSVSCTLFLSMHLYVVCHSCTFGTLALSYSCTITVYVLNPLSHYYCHALLNTYVSIQLLNTWDQIFQGGLNISYSVLKYSVRGDQIGGDIKIFMTCPQTPLLLHAYAYIHIKHPRNPPFKKSWLWACYCRIRFPHLN